MNSVEVFLSGLPNDMQVQTIENDSVQGLLLSYKIEQAYFIPLEHINLLNDPAGYANILGMNVFLNTKRQAAEKSLEFCSKRQHNLLRRSFDTQIQKVAEGETVFCPYPVELGIQ